jgi:hypothetical protein
MKKKRKPVHKLVNYVEHAACGVAGNTLWWAEAWSAVTCKRCLAVKTKAFIAESRKP